MKRRDLLKVILASTPVAQAAFAMSEYGFPNGDKAKFITRTYILPYPMKGKLPDIERHEHNKCFYSTYLATCWGDGWLAPCWTGDSRDLATSTCGFVHITEDGNHDDNFEF